MSIRHKKSEYGQTELKNLTDGDIKGIEEMNAVAAKNLAKKANWQLLGFSMDRLKIDSKYALRAVQKILDKRDKRIKILVLCTMPYEKGILKIHCSYNEAEDYLAVILSKIIESIKIF